MERLVRTKTTEKEGAKKAPSDLTFIHSGCTLLDLVLGGGWPLGRISNIVGDKSTGKTLLAIEGAANIAGKFSKGKIWYRETEAAFDRSYAGALGMPLDRIDFGTKKLDTVEDFFEDLQAVATQNARKRAPGLYILDSLDALSDRKELARDADKGSYGAEKAKQMSQLFRKLVRLLEDANIHLMIVSQVRDAIGVTFGRKTTRSGGHAMDFYASQIIYLAKMETIYKTRKGHERAMGVKIKVKCDKNKVAAAFGTCTFTIRFNYGVEDLQACFEWLIASKRTDVVDLSINEAKDVIASLDKMSASEYHDLSKIVIPAVKNLWGEIETSFMPKRKKYNGPA